MYEEKMRVLPLGLHANKKGADQPVHPAQSDQHLCCSLSEKSINAKLASCTWVKVQNVQNSKFLKLK